MRMDIKLPLGLIFSIIGIILVCSGIFYEKEILVNNSELYTVFNRDFSDAYLKGSISKDMFIDNPRDHSAIHRAEMYGGSTDENIEKAKQELYDEKTEIINHVRAKIEQLSSAKVPLMISISGECGAPLTVTVKTPDDSFVVRSELIWSIPVQKPSIAGCC